MTVIDRALDLLDADALYITVETPTQIDGAVKSWEVVYLPSAETVRLTPGQGPSRA